MDQANLVVMYNNTPGLEKCPFCEGQFPVHAGYRVFVMEADSPAIAAELVCDPCVEAQEPELLNMVKLHKQWESFNSRLRVTGGFA